MSREIYFSAVELCCGRKYYSRIAQLRSWNKDVLLEEPDVKKIQGMPDNYSQSFESVQELISLRVGGQKATYYCKYNRIKAMEFLEFKYGSDSKNPSSVDKVIVDFEKKEIYRCLWDDSKKGILSPMPCPDYEYLEMAQEIRLNGLSYELKKIIIW